MYYPSIKDIMSARHTIKACVRQTPLTYNRTLSERYEATVSLKREDLQEVRSYKIRGAYNKIASLTESEREAGIVCASAGNHAQGVAYSCNKLAIHGTIFMPITTPRQKINQVKMFGGSWAEVILVGDTFDATAEKAIAYCQERNSVFIHPFDDEKIIEGQATVGVEIMEEASQPIDYLFLPIGGGGVLSGVGSYFKQVSPDTKIIGVEPLGAASMRESLRKNEIVTLNDIDKFVDGAAVKKVGELTFAIARKVVDDIISVPEGKVCTTILELYNFDAIVAEPAGALTVAALEQYKEQIKGKNVVCLLSGGNNDILRMEEIKERSLLYEGLKHYFIVRFPQRAGALATFANEVLGQDDDITYFEYKKKTARENGPAVIGIELNSPNDFEGLISRMRGHGIQYEYLNDKPDLFEFLV